MKARRRPKLYNLSSFQRDFGLDRKWVSGFVCGAKLTTYRGDRNSLNVDEKARKQIVDEAKTLGLISA
jgi:hypothetical protein